MGLVPQVKVFKEQSIKKSQTGKAGVVAIIGCFEEIGCTVTTSGESTTVSGLQIQSFNSLPKSLESLGSDSTVPACGALPWIWHKNGGTSNILVVNITSGTSSSPDRTVTAAKLTAALNILIAESFDTLFIAAEIEDNLVNIVKNALDAAYEGKKPAGLISPLNRTTVAEQITTAEIFKDGGLYGFINQQYTIDSQLSLLNSAAYYCALISGKNLNESFTMKVLPEVTAVSPEYTFEDGSDGESFVNAGITVARCLDRVNKKHVIVNSELPSGLDLYIERTKDFIIKDLSLTDFLGERGKVSLAAIKSEVETKKRNYIETLDLLKDLSYSLEQKSSKCVEVHIEELIFEGIITEINLYVNVEVE